MDALHPTEKVMKNAYLYKEFIWLNVLFKMKLVLFHILPQNIQKASSSLSVTFTTCKLFEMETL